MAKKKKAADETQELDLSQLAEDMQAAVDNDIALFHASNEVENNAMPPADETGPIVYSESDALDQVADLDPNIKFVGRPGTPPNRVKVDGTLILLPGAEKQEKGFYHTSARDIVREYPNLYKKVVKKGA